MRAELPELQVARLAVPAKEGATPAMAQWFAAKEAHPDALVFFRMGDFYELFFADAEVASAALNIQLTERGSHAGQPIPMCGVPLHAAEAYLSRLIRHGFRVAIAEQTEDARDRKPGSKTPLQREIVRLVTPGTLTEESLLDPARPNWLVALAPMGATIGTARAEISAGKFETETISAPDLPDYLARLDPAEILAPPDLRLGDYANRRALVDPDYTAQDGLPDTFPLAEREAAAAVQAYLRATHGASLSSPLVPRSAATDGVLAIDASTRANLEILTAQGGGEYTLFAVVRHTLTGPGHRLLADLLSGPSTQSADIIDRQDAWAWLLTAPDMAALLRSQLKRLPDIARALARLRFLRAAPKDACAILSGLDAGHRLATALDAAIPAPPDFITRLRASLTPCPALLRHLAIALAPDPPQRLEDGDVIAAGFDAALDAARAARDDTRTALASLQQSLSTRHAIPNLRIRHHQQLGYVIEVAPSAAEQLRSQPGFVQRQSLAGCVRFSCPELVEVNQLILDAEEKLVAQEEYLWQSVIAAVMAEAPGLDALAAALAMLDVTQGSASLADSGKWCRPDITEGLDFAITGGRHPVVEAALPPESRIIANDCDLGPGRRVLLLTGPNMAGKSTFLRQNALIAVLAQAGLPVPARSARIGIVDRLFCRVGASDDLARGRSTFMVEMSEAATILHRATSRSLLVIDEIGRGTATLDGLAIAWAVLESIHDSLRSRTIFATHFHELIRLVPELPELKPYTMRVKTWKGSVVFLHEVVGGATGRSFGVEVAKLAGLPLPVVKRAEAILRALEAKAADLTQDLELPLLAQGWVADPGAAGPAIVSRLEEVLNLTEPDRLSPREALQLIYTLKSICDDDRALSDDNP